MTVTRRDGGTGTIADAVQGTDQGSVLLIEVHPFPEKAFSDGAQSLTLDQFRTLMNDLKPYLELWKALRVCAAAAV